MLEDVVPLVVTDERDVLVCRRRRAKGFIGGASMSVVVVVVVRGSGCGRPRPEPRAMPYCCWG